MKNKKTKKPRKEKQRVPPERWRKEEERLRPISLQPLAFDEAMDGFIALSRKKSST
jgi:hypothetical protein